MAKFQGFFDLVIEQPHVTAGTWGWNNGNDLGWTTVPNKRGFTAATSQAGGINMHRAFKTEKAVAKPADIWPYDQISITGIRFMAEYTCSGLPTSPHDDPRTNCWQLYCSIMPPDVDPNGPTNYFVSYSVPFSGSYATNARRGSFAVIDQLIDVDYDLRDCARLNFNILTQGTVACTVNKSACWVYFDVQASGDFPTEMPVVGDVQPGYVLAYNALGEPYWAPGGGGGGGSGIILFDHTPTQEEIDALTAGAVVGVYTP